MSLRISYFILIHVLGQIIFCMENKKNQPSPSINVTSSSHAVDPSTVADEEKSIQSIQTAVNTQLTKLKRAYYDPIVVPGEVVDIPLVEDEEEKAAQEADAKLTATESKLYVPTC